VAFWTSDTGSNPIPVRAVPTAAVPLRLWQRFILPWRSALLEVRFFLPALLSVGFRLPKVLGPFNGVPWASPMWGGGSNSHPRFHSQVFSTSQWFPSRPKVCGLVSCHYRSWDPPFRAFPSQGSRVSLEIAGSLAVIHRRAVVRRAFAFYSRFHRLPLAQLPGFPASYGLPFHEPRSVFRSSWAWLDGLTSFRQLHLLRSFPPLVNPLRRPWVAPPPPLDALLGSSPSKLSPATPRVLYPSGSRGSRPASSSWDSVALLKGPVTP